MIYELDKLRGLGVEVEARGDTVRLDGPRGVVTDEITEWVNANKTELLWQLALERQERLRAEVQEQERLTHRLNSRLPQGERDRGRGG